MNKLVSVFEDYQKALARLEETLQRPKTEERRDSAIKRFEMVFDISWKLIKAFVEEYQGLSCRSPKECFRVGFHQEILEFDNYWIQMADKRNEAVHTYKEALAEQLYGELPKMLEKFKELEQKIKENSQESNPTNG